MCSVINVNFQTKIVNLEAISLFDFRLLLLQQENGDPWRRTNQVQYLKIAISKFFFITILIEIGVNLKLSEISQTMSLNKHP